MFVDDKLLRFARNGNFFSRQGNEQGGLTKYSDMRAL